MPRTPLPLRSDDLSAFARTLAAQLGDASPSHLTLMNMLARAGGHRNVQHLRASQAAARRFSGEEPPAAVDHRVVERALHQFDAGGRLLRWPARRAVQDLALWALWAALPVGRSMSEREINERLGGGHAFHDPATLRRTMVAAGLLVRRRDGTDYRRVERRPPAEAVALIGRVLGRRRGPSAVRGPRPD